MSDRKAISKILDRVPAWFALEKIRIYIDKLQNRQKEIRRELYLKDSTISLDGAKTAAMERLKFEKPTAKYLAALTFIFSQHIGIEQRMERFAYKLGWEWAQEETHYSETKETFVDGEWKQVPAPESRKYQYTGWTRHNGDFMTPQNYPGCTRFSLNSGVAFGESEEIPASSGDIRKGRLTISRVCPRPSNLPTFSGNPEVDSEPSHFLVSRDDQLAGASKVTSLLKTGVDDRSRLVAEGTAAATATKRTSTVGIGKIVSWLLENQKELIVVNRYRDPKQNPDAKDNGDFKYR